MPGGGSCPRFSSGVTRARLAGERTGPWACCGKTPADMPA